MKSTKQFNIGRFSWKNLKVAGIESTSSLQTTKPPSWLIHVGQLTGRKELFLRLAKQKKGRLPSTPKRPKQMLGPSFFYLGNIHLRAVHLPLEHRQGLESHGEVDRRDRLVDGNVVAVQIPVGVDVHDGLVVLKIADRRSH